MKPVDQTRFGYPEGNCLMACVASVLEVPLELLPDLWEREKAGDDDWWMILRTALAEHGWEAIYLHPEYVSATNESRTSADLAPQGYALAGGPSPRESTVNEDGENAGHVVVAEDGQIVHDPHPSRDGLGGPVRDWIVLIPPRRTPDPDTREGAGEEEIEDRWMRAFYGDPHGPEEEEGLLPCPFCGSEAERRTWDLRPPEGVPGREEKPVIRHALICTECGVLTPWVATADQAIASWNRRAYPQEPGEVVAHIEVVNGMIRSVEKVGPTPPDGRYVVTAHHPPAEAREPDAWLGEGLEWAEDWLREKILKRGAPDGASPWRENLERAVRALLAELGG